MSDSESGSSSKKKCELIPIESIKLEKLLYDSDDDGVKRSDDDNYSEEEDSDVDEVMPCDALESSGEEDKDILRIQVQTPEIVATTGPSTQTQHLHRTTHIMQLAPINWNPNPTGFTQINFSKENKFLTLPQGNRPIDFFNLLVDDNFYELIVNETNRYAVEIFQSTVTREHSRITQWRDVTAKELRVFFGLLFHMGTININHLQDYWKKDRFFNLPFFSSNMSRDRFMLIMRCLHFNKNPGENETKPNDRLFKIRPVVDYFNNKMLQIYYPGKNLSLDESMVLWRGRLSFKAHKYGVMLYMLTEPDGTIIKFSVYTGGLDDICGECHVSNIVFHLMEERLDIGHSLFMDKYYNSYDLAEKLLERKTFCTGPLRIHCKNSPTDVKNRKLKSGETIARYCNGVMIAKWHDKQDVSYISTEYGNDMILYQNKRGHDKEKPKAIYEYNKYMGGVDRQHQILSYYPFERKTLRWYKKIGIHILHLLLFNSYSLYKKHTKSRISYYDFRMQVLDELIPPKPEIRAPLRVTQHVPTKNNPSESGRIPCRRCQVCFKRKIRKETAYYCAACPTKPPLCVTPCFGTFHKNL